MAEFQRLTTEEQTRIVKATKAEGASIRQVMSHTGWSYRRVREAGGGAAGVIHAATSLTTDCQPNDNVEAMRIAMDLAGIEARPLWKPMHKQPCYKDAPAYINGVSEELFKVGMCLPAGPYVKEEEVKYIVETIKNAIN